MNFSNISISARTKILNNKVDLNFSGTIDPYAIDTNNVRYNKYHGKLGRLTNATISTNFSFSADNGQNKEKKNDLVGQIVNFSGDLSLTPKWKINFQSGYDIKNKEVTSTSFGVTRDLHCWEMTFNCMPFGQHQSYNFEIHVRSSLLRDLKLTKRDSWYDRRL